MSTFAGRDDVGLLGDAFDERTRALLGGVWRLADLSLKRLEAPESVSAEVFALA